MVDDANLIEEYELKLFVIIDDMHKAGIRYTIVYGIFQELLKTLELQGYCEDWLGKYSEVDNG